MRGRSDELGSRSVDSPVKRGAAHGHEAFQVDAPLADIAFSRAGEE